jgi:hypothetical protein
MGTQEILTHFLSLTEDIMEATESESTSNLDEWKETIRFQLQELTSIFIDEFRNSIPADYIGDIFQEIKYGVYLFLLSKSIQLK